MNIVIIVYVIVSVVLLLFDIGFLFYKNYSDLKYYARDKKFEEQVEQELENGEEQNTFSREFQLRLHKSLCKTKLLISMQEVLTSNGLSMNVIRDILFNLQPSYKKKSDYEQAYYTYIISTLDYKKEKIPTEFASEFLEFLDSKSLYTFTNAMNAIYQFGEMNLLLAAIDKCDERAGFYHKKLLVDGLLECNIEKELLADKLIERFDNYSLYTQGCVMDYLRMAKCEVSDFCISLMDAEEKEIQYAAMRYFITNPKKETKKIFEDRLVNDEDWVSQMLSIQALNKYSDTKTREMIKTKINNPNWHVRVNAAEYLKKNGINKKELFELVCLKDKYADDILLYQFKEDAAMTEYLLDTIQKVEEGKEAAVDFNEMSMEGGMIA